MSLQHSPNTDALIKAISKLPNAWALTPCVGKQNLWPAWSKERLDRSLLIDAIQKQTNKSGRHTAWTGFSLISGPMSGGVMAIDFDGALALEKYLEFSGDAPIPETRMWTSGKSGHFQILLRVSPEKWEKLAPTKFFILKSSYRFELGLSVEAIAETVEAKSEDILRWESGITSPIPPAIAKKLSEIYGCTNGELCQKLEFRWNECSTLPPSIHPDTAQPYYWENWDENYDWGEGWEDFVAIAPDWVLEVMTGDDQTQSAPRAISNSTANRQPSQILEKDILPRLDAAEFYGEFVKLKKVGKTLKGLCPFHQEKTPSLTIDPTEKLFKCFGCGAGGGPVQFLHQIGGGSGSPSGKDFIDVVRQLGDRVGVSLEECDRKPRAEPSSSSNLKSAKLATNIIKFPEQKFKLTAEQIGEEIDTQLAVGATGSTLSLNLNRIAAASGVGIREIRQIYTERTQEEERVSDREDTAADVAQLLASKSARLNIAEILPATLAEPIDRLAKKMNLRAECYLLALLTQCGSLLRADTSTMLHPATNYRVRPNYFGVMVGESGEGKTPVLTAMILDPMQKLLDKARSDFEGAEAVYEAELASWTESKNKDKGLAPKPPIRKVYYFTKQTGEGITAQAGRLPEQGMLYLCDELASLFKSANQYRGGKGSDEEDLLEYWSGGGATVLRAGGLTIDVRNISLSIFGNIQPKVLAKFVGDGDDNNGKFARFDFIHQPPTITKLSGDSVKIDLNPMLTNLYEKLDNLSINYFELDKAAHDLFTSFYDDCSDRKFSHPKQGMRAMLAKAPAKVGKLATILHCIYAAHCGEEISEYISTESVQGAIKFVQYTIDQALNMNVEVETETNTLAPNLMKILEVTTRKGGTVSARDVSKSFTAKHRPTTQQVREWFSELVAMKYGTVSEKGQSCSFTSLSPSPSSPISYNQDASRREPVPDNDFTHPQSSPINFTSGDGRQAGDGFVPTAVGGSKPLMTKDFDSSADNGDDYLSNLISRLQAAQTWAECEAIWGADTELKAQIKAALSRKELARIGKLFKSAQEAETQKSPLPVDIDPIDAEKIRDIAQIWWDKYYPEYTQSLIVQMFGWQSPGQKYAREIINQWLETEDEFVRDRIHQLFNLNNSTEEAP